MRKVLSLFFVLVIFASSILMFFETGKFIQQEGVMRPTETITVLETKTNYSTTTAVKTPALEKPKTEGETKVAMSSVPVKKPTTSVPSVSPKIVKPIARNAVTSEVSVPPEKVLQTVSVASEPLTYTAPSPVSGGVVRMDEVLSWTNYYRLKNSLPPLSVSGKLNTSAKSKTEDMLANQYFEHVSLSGKDASGLAADVGYDYLLIGENLAYGDFADAKDLVDAWMASPGHRANILKTRYEEIGIYAVEGTFKGRRVWMAVQEFGRPASSCPLPDAVINKTIDAEKASVATYTIEADDIMTRMNTFEARGDYGSFNAYVPEYNIIVAKINALVADISTLVSEYNAQVEKYKICATG